MSCVISHTTARADFFSVTAMTRAARDTMPTAMFWHHLKFLPRSPSLACTIRPTEPLASRIIILFTAESHTHTTTLRQRMRALKAFRKSARKKLPVCLYSFFVKPNPHPIREVKEKYFRLGNSGGCGHGFVRSGDKETVEKQWFR